MSSPFPEETESTPDSKIKKKARNLIVNTVVSDSLILLLTFISKIINVIFTVLIARSVSKKSYALANIYFSFIYLLITTFPKSINRRCSLQYSHDLFEKDEEKKFKDATQVTWIINYIITFLSFFLYHAFTSFNSELLDYKLHLIIYIFSALLEIYAEPIMIYLDIRVSSNYKCFVMFFGDYMLLMLNYLFSSILHFDLWSFTLSRLFSSIGYFVFLVYLAKHSFHIFNEILPSWSKTKNGIKFLLKSICTKNEENELKALYISEIRSYSVTTMMQFTENVVLSFFVRYSDDIKADYSFVKENFSFFINHSISPSEENFFVLLNKIKNYKNLTTLKSSKDSTTNEYSGDFSLNENQYIIKEVSRKNKPKESESYSYKLLKTSIRLYFVIGIISISVLSLLGNEVLLMLFTDKWANDRTYKFIKLYLVYFSLKAISSKFSSYSSAIYSSEIRDMSRRFGYVNIFLMLTLAFSLSQIDISGLVITNIIYHSVKILAEWYFTVKNEFLFVKQYVVYLEMFTFAKEACVRISTILSTLACVTLYYIIGLASQFEKYEEMNYLVIFAKNIIIICNIIAVIFIEKEDFMDVLRLKVKNNY